MTAPATAPRGGTGRLTAPLLEVHDLTVHAGGAARPLLTDASFTLAPGEALGVVGPSGAGKSTLALALLGLLPRGATLERRSRIHLAGLALHDADAATWRAVRGRRIALVQQEPALALDPAMRIGPQVMEAARLHGVAVAEAEARAHAMLQRVGFRDAARLARRYPHELSGGQRQRALLAAAMLLAPELLVADEPTTALDPTIQAQVLDLVDALREESGTALLLISHDLDVVAERCGRVLVLEGGRVLQDAPTAAVLPATRAGRTPTGTAATGARPDRGHAASGPPAARMVAEGASPWAPTPPPAPLLEVRDLAVAYRGTRLTLGTAPPVVAVHEASLAIGPGEVLALVGESGCGKSSVAHALLRLVEPTAGTVRFDGIDVRALAREPLRRLRRRMQLVPQDAGASLTPHLTVEALVAEALEVHGLATGDEARRRVRTLLDELGLPARAATARPRQLSGGERQRVALARALACDPDLLVCDEPFASVDEATRTTLLAQLERRRAERGMALLLISHDLPAVRRLASRVLVMYLGRVVERADGARALRAPRMPYTQALVAAIPTGDPQAVRRRLVLHDEGRAEEAATGCPFHPRCPHPSKDDRCRGERPPLRPAAPDQPDHLVACWHDPLPPSP